jgi:hypothetical protein
MSKVSIDQFMTTAELVALANLRIVDERTLHVPVEPKAESFNKKDVLFHITPGDEEFTVEVLEQMLALVKSGKTIKPEWDYEYCSLVVYGEQYFDSDKFSNATSQFYTDLAEYNSIISENEKNRQIRDEIVTKAEERLKIIMRNKEYRERYFSLSPEFKSKMLAEFI